MFHYTVLAPAIKLGDKVFEDTNKDGIQDANEAGLANVTVILKDANGTEISRTTTDSNGQYLFDKLAKGHYTVEFVTPEGYTPSPSNQGDNDIIDSDGTNVDVDLQEDNLTIDSLKHL